MCDLIRLVYKKVKAFVCRAGIRWQHRSCTAFGRLVSAMILATVGVSRYAAIFYRFFFKFVMDMMSEQHINFIAKIVLRKRHLSRNGKTAIPFWYSFQLDIILSFQTSSRSCKTVKTATQSQQNCSLWCWSKNRWSNFSMRGKLI